MADKKSYKKKLKHLLVVQAAEKIFLEKPYNEISMDEISKQAGITKKTLYTYFPSKLALFTNMFEDYLRELHRQLTEALVPSLPYDQLLRIGSNILFEFTKKNKKFMLFFWTLDTDKFNGTIPQELIQRVNIWNTAMLNDLSKLVKKGQKEGAIVDCDPALLVHLISAANKGFFIHTNKQIKFNIINMEPKNLYNMFIEIIIKQFIKQP